MKSTAQNEGFHTPSPGTGATPTWLEVYTHWNSLKVPKVSVVDFNPSVHDAEVAWFEKYVSPEQRRGLYYHLQSPPRVDTARVLANAITNGGPSLYALFAIMTTIQQLDEWTPLQEAVQSEWERLASHTRQEWHGNARHILPCDALKPPSFLRIDKDWRLRVDFAAQVWKEIASRFQVVRQARWAPP